MTPDDGMDRGVKQSRSIVHIEGEDDGGPCPETVISRLINATARTPFLLFQWRFPAPPLLLDEQDFQPPHWSDNKSDQLRLI